MKVERTLQDQYDAYHKRAKTLGWNIKEYSEWLQQKEYYKKQYAREVGKPRSRTAGKRKCLTCGERFYSTHSGNRMCRICVRRY